MAKKIKFSLEMDNEVRVRTLDELRANFSLQKVLKYYSNGKLITWLRDRYYNDIANKIEKINSEDKNFNQRICEIFNVDFNCENINIKQIKEKEAKIEKLKKYADYEKFSDLIDNIIFSQEELKFFLDKLTSDNDLKPKKIYLCGDKFIVNDKFKNITYIGVNKVCIYLTTTSKIFDAQKNNIKFENVIISSKDKLALKIKKNNFDINTDKICLKSIHKILYGKTVSYDVAGSLIVDSNGKVIAAGSHANGTSFIPQFEAPVVSVDLDISIAIALDKNGKVYQWGTLPYSFENVPNNLPPIKQLTLGGGNDFAIALDENGKLHWWGKFNHNIYFNGKHECYKLVATPIPEFENPIVQIATTNSHIIVALDEKGKVYAWGSLDNPAINVPSNLPFIKKVLLYDDFVLALDDQGKIHFWGTHKDGNSDIPSDLPYIVDIFKIKDGRFYAMDEDGKIHVWGNNAEEVEKELSKFKAIEYLVDNDGLGVIDENNYLVCIYGNIFKLVVHSVVYKDQNRLKISLPQY